MPEGTTQSGIELKLDNGMVIKGENAEEALKSAAKIIEDNVKYSRETKAQLEQLQQQFNTVQQQVQAQKPKPESSNGFAKDKYYQLLNEDPLEAQNYLDAYRFGISDPDQVPQRFNQMYEKISQLDGANLAASFANAHPEFPSDTESANKLTERVRILNGMGHPADVHTLDLAWQQLLTEGTVKALEKEQEPEELPPSLGGGGYTMAEAQKAENMSDRELMALLKAKDML